MAALMAGKSMRCRPPKEHRPQPRPPSHLIPPRHPLLARPGLWIPLDALRLALFGLDTGEMTSPGAELVARVVADMRANGLEPDRREVELLSLAEKLADRLDALERSPPTSRQLRRIRRFRTPARRSSSSPDPLRNSNQCKESACNSTIYARERCRLYLAGVDRKPRVGC